MSWPNGTADQGAQYQQRPPRSVFFDSIRGSGWYRAKPRVIGGVCSGISARQGWDLSLVRVLVVVGAFLMPFVPLAYGLAWLFLPEAEDGRIHVEETIGGRFDVAVIGGALMVLASVSSSLSDIGFFGFLGLSWFKLLIGALSMSGIVVAIVVLARPGNRSAGQQRPPYGAAQYGTPQYRTPQYGSAPGAPTPNATDTSVPFGQATPAADGAGAADPGSKPEQAPSDFPSYGVPSDFQSSPTGAASSQAGPAPAAARPAQPHPSWTPPPTAPRPRQWTPPSVPMSRPRTVSGRVNLAITGLLVLVVAAVFAGLYWADKGLTVPFLTGETQGQTIARLITIGGGVCLIIVGLSLAIAALRDRSAGWLTALSIIGLIMALPTAAIGSQASHPTDFLNVGPSGIGSQTTLNWTVDKVSGGNPTGSTTLDLTGAPVGTTKTITVDWQAWSRLTIQVAEGQPVQIVCQSSIDDLTTNMDGNGWAAPLGGCSGVTVSSPAWGQPTLGGITVIITDDANIDTLTILQTPDSSGAWSSAPTATPSATPSATPTPSPTPTGSQSGN
jgi:Putative stress-responsive transcriptional regulator